MKKVCVYVLSLGVLLGIIFGAVFAAEATAPAQNGIDLSLSTTAEVASRLNATEVYGPNEPNEPGGLCAPSTSGTSGQSNSGVFDDFQYPLLFALGIVVIMVLLI